MGCFKFLRRIGERFRKLFGTKNKVAPFTSEDNTDTVSVDSEELGEFITEEMKKISKTAFNSGEDTDVAMSPKPPLHSNDHVSRKIEDGENTANTED